MLFLWLKHRQCYHKRAGESYCVMVGMLRDLFMMRRTSTSGRLSCFVWAHPSSAAAMCRSKRSDTDFFRSLGFPLKKEPSHCFITLSIFSVLVRKRLEVLAIKGDDDTCINAAQHYALSDYLDDAWTLRKNVLNGWSLQLRSLFCVCIQHVFCCSGTFIACDVQQWLVFPFNVDVNCQKSVYLCIHNIIASHVIPCWMGNFNGTVGQKKKICSFICMIHLVAHQGAARENTFIALDVTWHKRPGWHWRDSLRTRTWDLCWIDQKQNSVSVRYNLWPEKIETLPL